MMCRCEMIWYNNIDGICIWGEVNDKRTGIVWEVWKLRRISWCLWDEIARLGIVKWDAIVDW